MKRYTHIWILFILLGCLMLLLMIGMLHDDGFFGLMMQRLYVWSFLILGLTVGLYIALSYHAIIWIEKLFASYLQPNLRYLVYPLVIPMTFMIILGFALPSYFAFACASLTGLFMARSYVFLQKKRNVVDSNRLRYRLLVRYTLFLVVISLLLYYALMV
jgi:hypothetical protein